MDITKINWILVICSKCDTVMQSYEPGPAAKTTTTLSEGKHATQLTILRNLQVCVEIKPQLKCYQ